MITIDFLGICTHIPIPPDHRVVLVNATSGARVDKGGPLGRSMNIPPHFATIQFKYGEFEVVNGKPGEPFGGGPFDPAKRYPLTGLQVEQIENKDRPLLYRRCWDQMPRLTRHAQAHSWSLSRDAIDYGRVASYIEIRGGTFSTEKVGCRGMVHARLEIEDGETLEFKRIWNGESIGVIVPGPNSFIEIRNEPENSRDETDDDFLLHYRIFESLPFQFTPPSSDPLVSAGPAAGCSNSLYP